MAQVVTDTSFEEEVLNSSIPVLVDFWAEWCGPCKMISPIIDELSNELSGKVKVCKMDIEANPEMPSKMGIRSIPTLVLFKEGKQVAIRSGAIPKNIIDAWLKSFI